MKLLSRNDVRKIDQALLDSGTELLSLILEVGDNLHRWFSKHVKKRESILIVCGPGNNGGDGLALASFLKHDGFNVSVYLIDQEKTMANETLNELCVSVKDILIDELALEKFQIVVDAIFGIGLNQNPQPPYSDLINRINQFSGQIISLDIPSGVDCNSGRCFEPTIRADHTLTISNAKQGMYFLPGNEYCGEIHVVPVESLDQVGDEYGMTVQSLEWQETWAEWIEPQKDSNKYSRGKVSLVMGEKYPGACLLAALAAQNSGAGYIQIHCPQQLLHFNQIQYPQFVFEGYKTLSELERNLLSDNSQALIAGPGWTDLDFDITPLLKQEKTLVFDGGLLQAPILGKLQGEYPAHVILTPHSGELARLVDLKDSFTKWDAVESILSQCNISIVAKGYDTLIANREEKFITTWNAPLLATAGTGDILAGMIGSLAAQGLDAMSACCFAVGWHRKIGKKAKHAAPPLWIVNQLLKSL